MSALRAGVATVICDGAIGNCITNVVAGKKIGTLFTASPSAQGPAVELIASNGTLTNFVISLDIVKISMITARESSRSLQLLNNFERSEIVRRLANLLMERQNDILEANSKDLDAAKESGLAGPLLARLKLTPEKIEALYTGLIQISDAAKNTVGRIQKQVGHTQAETLIVELSHRLPAGSNLRWFGIGSAVCPYWSVVGDL